MRVCIWCYASFEARSLHSPNRYALPSAGLRICWDCSDRYEQALIGLRFDKLKCRLHDVCEVITDNGFILPITLQGWQRSSLPWGHPTARGVDSAGKNWKAIDHGGLLTLKPIT